MNRWQGLMFAGLVGCGVAAAAWAAGASARIRGTLESVGTHALAIKTYAGSERHVRLASATKYVWVVPGQLDRIGKGDFIGAAATGPKDHLTAVEVVIFPNSMRGTGEGFYPWSLPAAVAQADLHGVAAPAAPTGAPPVQGTMTNGTVADVGGAPAGAPPVEGTMTNATVTRASSNAGGGRTLTVTYNGGQKVQITVLPGTPVVRFVRAGRSILAAGQKIFTIASVTGDAEPVAGLVAVGKNGLMPPM